MRKELFLATAATLLLASPTLAENGRSGIYTNLGGGVNYVHDDNIEGSGFNQEQEMDWGGIIAGALGYKTEFGLRGELELGYRGNDFDEIEGNVNTSGDADVYTVMANILYDVPLGMSPWMVYGGVGGGMARVEYNDVQNVAGGLLDDDDTVPAVQGIAGVSYTLSDLADLYLNYQYLYAFNPEFDNAVGGKSETDYESSSALFGVKFKFYGNEAAPAPAPVAQPAPPPPPPPAPSPISRSYIVFFDFDKTNLTPEAMNVLRQAATDAKAGRAVAVNVVGHADRSGTDSYNMALSKRRASVVEGELTKLGIADSMIKASAKGESDPLLATPDGVREPQNRRAEITFVITPQR